jgi:hypothetical protein
VVYIKKRKDLEEKSSEKLQSKKTPKTGKNPLKIALTSEKKRKKKSSERFF